VLLPICFAAGILNYLDRTNLSFAALELNADLGFTPVVSSGLSQLLLCCQPNMHRHLCPSNFFDFYCVVPIIPTHHVHCAAWLTLFIGRAISPTCCAVCCAGLWHWQRWVLPPDQLLFIMVSVSH
jgi:hypothetical protein